jgi:hypothetical protein
MAEAFEDRLYAVLLDLEAADPEYLERFKAKGDAAFLFADLNAEPEDLDEEIAALMAEFGVASPSGKAPIRQTGLFRNEFWDLRDITVGELREAVASGSWPEDAWSYHKNTFWDHLGTLIIIPVSLTVLIALSPVLMVFIAGLWLKDLVSRKPA